MRRVKIDENGYRILSVSNGRGSADTFKVARLVCEAFHGSTPADRPEVDHKDRDRSMDHEANLRWCTRLENIENSEPAVGEDNGRSILTEQQVREIRASTETRAALAVRYGVAKRTISGVKSRETWRHVA